MNAQAERTQGMVQATEQLDAQRGPTGRRSWIGGLLLVATLLLPSLARAQVAVHVEGQGAGKIRATIIKQLPAGITAITPAAFKTALGRDKLGDKALKPSRQKQLVAELKSVGQLTAAQLIVVAVVKQNSRSLWVMALGTDSSGIRLDKTYTIRKLVTKRKKRRRKKVPGPLNLRQVNKALAPIFATLAPPAAPAEEIVAVAGEGVVDPGVSETVPASPDSVSDAIEPQLRRSGAAIEPRFFVTGRKLSFLRRNENIRGYRADAIPMIGANAEFYPGALFGVEAIEWLGVGFRFATAFGLESHPRNDDSESFGTEYWVVEGDLRPRLNLGPLTLAAAIGAGGTTFEFDVPLTSTLINRTPGVSYVYLRGGIEARLMIGPVSILAGGAYLHNFSTGALGVYFPNGYTYAFAVNGGAAFQIFDWLELTAGFDYVQVMHTFDAEADGYYQAESATDQLYGGRFGVVLFYPN